MFNGHFEYYTIILPAIPKEKLAGKLCSYTLTVGLPVIKF